MAKMKLMQEVETRWSSTYLMLQCLVVLNEPAGAALVGLQHDMPMITSDEFRVPFFTVSCLWCHCRAVSRGPCVCLQSCPPAENAGAKPLGENDSSSGNYEGSFYTWQSMSIMSLVTLLDPQFKVIGFFRQTKATEVIKDQCKALIMQHKSKKMKVTFMHINFNKPISSTCITFICYWKKILIFSKNT